MNLNCPNKEIVTLFICVWLEQVNWRWEGTYIIGGLVFWGLKCVKQARAAFQSINYALIVVGIWMENLQLLAIRSKPIELQFIWTILQKHDQYKKQIKKIWYYYNLAIARLRESWANHGVEPQRGQCSLFGGDARPGSSLGALRHPWHILYSRCDEKKLVPFVCLSV